MIYLLISSIVLVVILFIIYVRKNIKFSEEIVPSLTIDKDNITICKEMLKILKNNHTNVEYNKDKNSKLSYYNHKQDIIILKADNSGSSRIIQIAHECIHTTQQIEYLNANRFFSNLQILYFFISLMFIIKKVEFEMLIIAIQLLILIGTLFVKVVIEGDASYRSINLASEYLKNNKEAEIYIEEVSKLIYNTMSIYYMNFFVQGMTMVIINSIITLIV